MLLPSAVQSRPVTSVASSGVFVTCTDFPVATSATKICDASSKFAMYATCVPVGDQVCARERRALRRLDRLRRLSFADRRASSPVCVLVVRVRARFAFVSICRPPRLMCDLPYASMSPRSAPVALQKPFPVRARRRERDVRARRHDHVLDVRGRLHERLGAQDLLRIPALLRDVLRARVEGRRPP